MAARMTARRPKRVGSRIGDEAIGGNLISSVAVAEFDCPQNRVCDLEMPLPKGLSERSKKPITELRYQRSWLRLYHVQYDRGFQLGKVNDPILSLVSSWPDI
jgi:hypothetical protein